MPVQLAPLSRRDFFRRSLLAGAGLAVAPSLVAASRRADPHAWALMADTHVAGDATLISRGVNMADHLRRASQDLLDLPKRPAGVFIVGDCAFSSGETEDYATLAGLLDPLRRGGLPVNLALGNHDHRDNVRAALAARKEAKRAVTDKHVALIRAEHVNWFMLDSLEKTLVTPGSLGADQLKWLANALDTNRRKPAVVLVHHHPAVPNAFGALKDTQELLEVIRPRKHVKAWIYGHTHRWLTATDESGLHLVNLPPVAYVFGEGRPSGWVHATLRRDGVRLELRCVDAAHPNHGQVVDLNWRAG